MSGPDWIWPSWALKYDIIRDSRRWTVTYPGGRIGNFHSRWEALQAAVTKAGRPLVENPKSRKVFPWGHVTELVPEDWK